MVFNVKLYYMNVNNYCWKISFFTNKFQSDCWTIYTMRGFFFTLRYLNSQGKINSSPLVVVFTRSRSKPNLIQCNSRLRMSLNINMFILRSFTNMKDFFVVYPLKKYNLVRFPHHVYCTHCRNRGLKIGQLNLKMALPCRSRHSFVCVWCKKLLVRTSNGVGFRV